MAGPLAAAIPLALRAAIPWAVNAAKAAWPTIKTMGLWTVGSELIGRGINAVKGGANSVASAAQAGGEAVARAARGPVPMFVRSSHDGLRAAAFLEGVDLFCKEARLDSEDRDAMYRLLKVAQNEAGEKAKPEPKEDPRTKDLQGSWLDYYAKMLPDVGVGDRARKALDNPVSNFLTGNVSGTIGNTLYNANSENNPAGVNFAAQAKGTGADGKAVTQKDRIQREIAAGKKISLPNRQRLADMGLLKPDQVRTLAAQEQKNTNKQTYQQKLEKAVRMYESNAGRSRPEKWINNIYGSEPSEERDRFVAGFKKMLQERNPDARIMSADQEARLDRSLSTYKKPSKEPASRSGDAGKRSKPAPEPSAPQSSTPPAEQGAGQQIPRSEPVTAPAPTYSPSNQPAFGQSNANKQIDEKYMAARRAGAKRNEEYQAALEKQRGVNAQRRAAYEANRPGAKQPATGPQGATGAAGPTQPASTPKQPGQVTGQAQQGRIYTTPEIAQELKSRGWGAQGGYANRPVTGRMGMPEGEGLRQQMTMPGGAAEPDPVEAAPATATQPATAQTQQAPAPVKQPATVQTPNPVKQDPTDDRMVPTTAASFENSYMPQEMSNAYNNTRYALRGEPLQQPYKAPSYNNGINLASLPMGEKAPAAAGGDDTMGKMPQQGASGGISLDNLPGDKAPQAGGMDLANLPMGQKTPSAGGDDTMGGPAQLSAPQSSQSGGGIDLANTPMGQKSPAAGGADTMGKLPQTNPPQTNPTAGGIDLAKTPMGQKTPAAGGADTLGKLPQTNPTAGGVDLANTPIGQKKPVTGGADTMGKIQQPKPPANPLAGGVDLAKTPMGQKKRSPNSILDE